MAIAPNNEDLWHLVIHDDTEHTYNYVIGLCRRLLMLDAETALRFATEVDTNKKAVIEFDNREKAEAIAELISQQGPDPLLPHSRASLKVTVQLATAENGTVIAKINAQTIAEFQRKQDEFEAQREEDDYKSHQLLMGFALLLIMTLFLLFAIGLFIRR